MPARERHRDARRNAGLRGGAAEEDLPTHERAGKASCRPPADTADTAGAVLALTF
jgi:hypothetical protein